MSRILLIEPNVVLARLYQGALEAKGHTVTHVETAQDALFAIESFSPDKIILEIDIPGHNGLEFLYEFCSYNDWSHIPITIHTSLKPHLFQRMKVAWHELSVENFLYKPETSLQQLQQSVPLLK